MQVYEGVIWQDNMPLLAFDRDNPKVELKYVTDEVLRAEYPHQVIIEAYLCTGRQMYEKQRFCDILGLRLCKKIGGISAEDVLYRIFAFAEPRHAQVFTGRFGGLRYVMGKAATAD
jgi:hypothetical protein